MANEIIKEDVRVTNITDKSKCIKEGTEDEEIVTIRTVTLKNESKTLSITISKGLKYHTLNSLDPKTDINLDASLTLKLGDPYQKKII